MGYTIRREFGPVQSLHAGEIRAPTQKQKKGIGSVLLVSREGTVSLLLVRSE